MWSSVKCLGIRQVFGIEASSRQMNQMRARTTSRKPGIRLMLVSIAFTLRNLWVFICWAWLGLPRRGSRQIDAKRFRLSRMAHFLLQAVEAICTISSIERPFARAPT